MVNPLKVERYSIIILVTEGIDLKDIKDNDLAMSNKNFTLTYDELLLLLKDAYRNGYSTYEMTAAGLEPNDDDGYARWVLLGMKSNEILASNKDKDIFFNELLNPSEPNKALKDAVAKYKMKPTAVEWLVNELSKSKYYYKIIEDINAMGTVERDVIKEAKDMERDDMIHEPKKLTEAIDVILEAVNEKTWTISWTDCPTKEI